MQNFSDSGDHPQALHATSLQALEAAGIGTWRWEFSNDLFFWDALTHKIFGLESRNSSALSAAVIENIFPDDRELMGYKMARSRDTQADLVCEFRVIWPSDQSLHFISIKGRPYRDPDGTALGVTGACWDITERRLMEEELAHERFLLRTLMEHMPDKIYFKDTASRFTRVSRALLRMFNASSPEEVLGKTDFDFFSTEHARQAYEDEQRIIQTGEPIVGLEERETWTDGHETWMSTTKLPIFDEHGKIIGTFGISRDITDRRRAETQLAKYTTELRRRNTELEDDLEMARELQCALMPKHYPVFPPQSAPEASALRFSYFFHPSMAVSGDFFDVLELSETSAGIFICDVMGHGMRAALVAAIVRALVGEMKGIGKNPSEFLSRLNHKLFGILSETDITLFATAAYVVIDYDKGELRYSNAGHPDPFWIRHQGGEAQVLALTQAKRGPVLGLFQETQYTTTCEPLSEGDMVLLFTDGLFEVEGNDGELYDQRCLLDAVQRRTHLSAETLCQEVLTEVQQFSAEKHFDDDVCLVAVEVQHMERKS